MSDLEFSINFGNVQEKPEFEKPPEGSYVLIIKDITVQPPKKESSAGKGVTLNIQFIIDEPEWSEFPLRDFLWVHFENPFGVLEFFNAVTGRDLKEEGETLSFSASTRQAFIGEKVGAILENQDNNGKTYLKPSSYYYLPL
jgi:hypothetical protein